MMGVGVIGLGDMGSGIAKNLILNGYTTTGFDLSEERMQAFIAMGGSAAANVQEVTENTNVVYVMVMNGDQAKEVILGQDGLVRHMKPGGVVILTATILPKEAQDIARAMSSTEIHLIDSPVSGGFSGAQGGTLTMMAAGMPDILDQCEPVMQAISKTIHRIGENGGDGQSMKACLQSLIGAIFSATFEASVLAAKAGISGENLFKVFSTSGAGCGCTNTALENIIERKFEKTGSHIATMHKDLTIVMRFAEALGVPLHTASTAMQLFHCGKSKYPDGDNWAVARVIEEIVGTQLHR